MSKSEKRIEELFNYFDDEEKKVMEMVARKRPLGEMAIRIGKPISSIESIIHKARFSLGANDDLIDDYFDLLGDWKRVNEQGSVHLADLVGDADVSEPGNSSSIAVPISPDKRRALEAIEANWKPVEMRDLAGSLLRLADSIEQDWNPDLVQSDFHWPTSDARIEKNSVDLARRAKILVRQHELRRKFLPSDLFGDPAWSILLDLFIQFSGGAKVSCKSLIIASSAPPSTAIRYMDRLEEAGLIKREKSSLDGRVSLFKLTKDGVVGVGRVLESISI